MPAGRNRLRAGSVRPRPDIRGPRIVFDPVSGEGELHINRHTKQCNGGWFGPEEVLVGDLNLGAGRFNSEDGVVTWYHVTATLTGGEGNTAFSNFHTPGGNLAP
nr:HtaA domain-containing protein [Corynebacterium meridianum]